MSELDKLMDEVIAHMEANVNTLIYPEEEEDE